MVMSSNQRTYSRKRRDAAEEKFDALFAREAAKAVPGEENKHKKPILKCFSPTKKARFSNGVDKSSQGGVIVIPLTGRKSPVKHSSAASFANGKHASVHSNHTSCSPVNSKYDLLFQKSERSASDKFDAIFGDEIQTTSTNNSQFSDVRHVLDSPKNPDFDNLFGFGDPTTEKIMRITNADNIQNTKDQDKNVKMTKIYGLSKKKSPSKHSNITGATMKTVGGKVVLNIQKRAKSPRKSASVPTALSEEAKTQATHDYAGDLVLPRRPKFKKEEEPDNDFIKIKSLNSKPLTTLSIHDKKPFFHIKDDISDTDVKLQNASISLLPLKTKPESPASTTKPVCFRSKVGNTMKKKHSPVMHVTQLPSSKPVYNSRPWMEDVQDFPTNTDKDSQSLSQPDPPTDEYDFPTPKLTRSVTWPEKVGDSIVTSIKCDKTAKAYFTVVKHVKNYQNCLEEGEAQEYEDELEYLLEGLQSGQPLAVRCLSVTNLASKCQQANFRLYLRAHNFCDRIFSHLQDAKDSQALALSTAALLFMLSRDRQMEINRKTLQLLLQLIDPFDKDDEESTSEVKRDPKKSKKESKYKFFKSKDKESQKKSDELSTLPSISKIKEMVDACGDHLLSGKDVSVKRLSSEALLRFTARRTVDWYREEVRLKGGLDHIISLVKSQVDSCVATAKLIQDDDKFNVKPILHSLVRLLKVLENAIVNSPRNAMYMVTHQRAILLKKISKLLSLCKTWLSRSSCQPVSIVSSDVSPSNDLYSALHTTILQITKLLVNISNDNEWVSSRVGEQDGMLSNIADCILVTPTQLQEEHKYELLLLSLSLLVNLVESSAKNRIALMRMTFRPANTINGQGDASTESSVVESLVKLFLEREAAARENEVLGESGVKKAVEAKKASTGSRINTAPSSSDATRNDGHWVETEDGMEWVPSEESDDVTHRSQDSCRSNVSASKNPESALTAEEKDEMRETLDKANEHMEDSIVASYAGLVLGCLIYGNRANSSVIRGYLGNDAGLTSMTRMLKKFLSFMSLTAGMSNKGEKTLTHIIEVLEEEAHTKT